jgi:hypothetical protein
LAAGVFAHGHAGAQAFGEDSFVATSVHGLRVKSLTGSIVKTKELQLSPGGHQLMLDRLPRVTYVDLINFVIY